MYEEGEGGKKASFKTREANKNKINDVQMKLLKKIFVSLRRYKKSYKLYY